MELLEYLLLLFIFMFLLFIFMNLLAILCPVCHQRIRNFNFDFQEIWTGSLRTHPKHQGQNDCTLSPLTTLVPSTFSLMKPTAEPGTTSSSPPTASVLIAHSLPAAKSQGTSTDSPSPPAVWMSSPSSLSPAMAEAREHPTDYQAHISSEKGSGSQQGKVFSLESAALAGAEVLPQPLPIIGPRRGTAILDTPKGRAEDGKILMQEAETPAAPLPRGQVPYSQVLQPLHGDIQTGGMVEPPTGMQEPPGILSLQHLEQSFISSTSLNQMVKDLQLHNVQSLVMFDGVLRMEYPMYHSRGNYRLGCTHPLSLRGPLLPDYAQVIERNEQPHLYLHLIIKLKKGHAQEWRLLLPLQGDIQTGGIVAPPTGMQEPPGILSLQHLEQSFISSMSLSPMVKDLQLHTVQSLVMFDGVLRAEYPMHHSHGNYRLGCPHPFSLRGLLLLEYQHVIESNEQLHLYLPYLIKLKKGHAQEWRQVLQPLQGGIQTRANVEPPTGMQEPPGILSLQHLEQSFISSISLNQMVKDLQLHNVQSLVMFDGVLRMEYPMYHSRGSCRLGCPHPLSLLPDYARVIEHNEQLHLYLHFLIKLKKGHAQEWRLVLQPLQGDIQIGGMVEPPTDMQEPPGILSLQHLEQSFISSISLNQMVKDLQLHTVQSLEMFNWIRRAEYPMYHSRGSCSLGYPLSLQGPMLCVYPRIIKRNEQLHLYLDFLLKVKKGQSQEWRLVKVGQENEVKKHPPQRYSRCAGGSVLYDMDPKAPCNPNKWMAQPSPMGTKVQDVFSLAQRAFTNKARDQEECPGTSGVHHESQHVPVGRKHNPGFKGFPKHRPSHNLKKSLLALTSVEQMGKVLFPSWVPNLEMGHQESHLFGSTQLHCSHLQHQQGALLLAFPWMTVQERWVHKGLDFYAKTKRTHIKKLRIVKTSGMEKAKLHPPEQCSSNGKTGDPGAQELTSFNGPSRRMGQPILVTVQIHSPPRLPQREPAKIELKQKEHSLPYGRWSRFQQEIDFMEISADPPLQDPPVIPGGSLKRAEKDSITKGSHRKKNGATERRPRGDKVSCVDYLLHPFICLPWCGAATHKPSKKEVQTECSKHDPNMTMQSRSPLKRMWCAMRQAWARIRGRKQTKKLPDKQ